MNSLESQTQFQNQFALKVNPFAFSFDEDFCNFSNYQSGKISNIYSNIADFSFNLEEQDRTGIQNASSLLFASLQDDSRQGLRRFTPEPVFAEKRNAFFLRKNPHSKDFDVRTADKSTKDAMIEGYTISNNDANEIAYDLDLTKITNSSSNNISSNILAGNNINIVAGDYLGGSSCGGGTTACSGDVLISASKLIAQNNININSIFGQTTITSAIDESFEAISTVEQDYNDISIEYNRGRLSLDSTSEVHEEDIKTVTSSQKSSELLAGNSININAKNDINILSSNLSANNQINLISSEGNTNILANTNTSRMDKEIREGTLTLSVGVGHVALDAVYAADDLVKAGESVKDAKEKLSEMKKLHKEGKADSDAVKDAEINLAISLLNVTLATLKLAAAADKAKSSTFSYGFYADLQLTRSGDKTNITTNDSNEVGSNIIANNDITILSGLNLIDPELNQDLGNTNIKGTIISNNGNINITSKNNTNITALNNTSIYNMKSEGFTQTVTLGASYGQSALQQMVESIQAQISLRESKSDNSNINYQNTLLLADNGNININSMGTITGSGVEAGNTTIKGAMILAENITINSQGNLTIESLQNSTHTKSKSTSVGGGGGGSSGTISYNSNKESFDRDWVDDQTAIIGTNSVNINTGNDTKIKGAVVANITNGDDLVDDFLSYGVNSNTLANATDGGNLNINTNTLTVENIQDREKQKVSGIGIDLTLNTGDVATQQSNYYPKGSLGLSAQSHGYEKEQTTFATIGAGNINVGGTQVFDSNGDFVATTGGTSIEQRIINLENNPNKTDQEVAELAMLSGLNRDITKSQIITKDTITGALDISTTIDLRLLDWTGKGQKEIWGEVTNLPTNTLIIGKNASDLLAMIPGSPVWASRMIDKYNDEIRNGESVNHPAPNFWTGNPFDKDDEPSVGRGDDECKNNGICKYTISDRAPHLQFLHYLVPGFKSFSQFHDAGMVNPDETEKSGTYKFFTIFPYIPANYYGATGTLIDIRNWNKNSSQNNNNSNPVSSHDKKNE